MFLSVRRIILEVIVKVEPNESQLPWIKLHVHNSESLVVSCSEICAEICEIIFAGL